ncbi:Structural maintenance of chromosomes protein [Penicillium hetheringtonii]|uniref:Structural maintenance of chromosomes protein n=1 Tax=Penicillium hetheringtonii TaxID=911720 RepID=A0AAD6GNU8_9EURO|nr:Structural maintenance of chromosomes protein [Penicillium hetheringtonii]
MASLAKGRPSRRSAPRRSYVVEETSESEDPGNVTPTPSNHDNDEESAEEEEDYTPVPKQAKRASRSKRMTLDPVTPATVKPTRKSRQSVASLASESEASQAEETDGNENDENDENTENDENDEGPSMVSVVADPDSPSHQAALKRKSIEPAELEPGSPSNTAALKRQSMASRKSRGSITPKAAKGSLPTPEPSASPESEARAQRESVPPLTDITESAVNQSSPSKPAEEPRSQVSYINPNSTVLEKPMDIVMKSQEYDSPSTRRTCGSQAPNDYSKFDP